jgi:hypothetical protein
MRSQGRRAREFWARHCHSPSLAAAFAVGPALSRADQCGPRDPTRRRRLGSAAHARVAKRLRAVIARSQQLGTQQAEREARGIVDEVVTGLTKHADAPLTPDDVDAIISRAEAERASDLAAPAGVPEADVSARGRDALSQSKVEGRGTGDAGAPEPEQAHRATETEVGARKCVEIETDDDSTVTFVSTRNEGPEEGFAELTNTEGSADDPLVRIIPEDIEGTTVSRGAWPHLQGRSDLRAIVA